jgi:hypothetical protein
LAGILLSIVATACSSVGHTWQDEFSARLEGAAVAIEEARAEVRDGTNDAGSPEVFHPLGRVLESKGDLIEDLDPPAGCEKLEEEGFRRVYGFAGGSRRLPMDMTPQLEENLPRILEGEVAALKQLAAEAETCAAG